MTEKPADHGTLLPAASRRVSLQNETDTARRLLISLEEMVSDSDDVDDGKLPNISAATLTRARQAIAAARRAR